MEGLPTKVQLIKINILPEVDNEACAFWIESVDIKMHLFKNCVISKAVLNDVFSWLGIEMEEGNCSLEDYLILIFSKWKRRFLEKLGLLWRVTVWILWLNRNTIIFKDEDLENLEFVNRIKSLLWDWHTSFFCSNVSHCWENWKCDSDRILTCRFL